MPSLSVKRLRPINAVTSSASPTNIGLATFVLSRLSPAVAVQAEKWYKRRLVVLPGSLTGIQRRLLDPLPAYAAPGHS